MNKKLGLLLAAVALVAATAVVTVMLVDDDTTDDTTDDATGETTDDPRAAPTSLSPLDRACLDAGGEFRVRVYFAQADSDGHMRRAADALRDDDRVARLETETQSEAYERFKEIFKDQPDLVEKARPDSLPASIEVSPAEGVSNSDLAGDLEDELTGVDEIEEMACVS